MINQTQIVQDLIGNTAQSKVRGQRRRFSLNERDPNIIFNSARELLGKGRYLEALDLYEEIHDAYPQYAIPVLCEVYEIYKVLPEDRYSLYQSRHFDFGISPSDKVLDVGSGHLPFPLATHLAEYAIEDGNYGRAGSEFKYVDGKPVTECSVESMPFGDKEFDFSYCSHVLEHVDSPERACAELMRVSKAGYIETPLRGKDLFLNTGKISNHRWGVELLHGKLIFTEYKQEELEGISNDILLNMHIAPQTQREMAFAALVSLKADRMNVMLLWENEFSFEVRRLDGSVFVRNAAR